jgi:predicted DNA-binding protein (MmcQ/YjbR family)
MNKEHWNTVLLDGSLPDELVRSLADGSYELVEASLTATARAEAGLPPRPRRRS